MFDVGWWWGELKAGAKGVRGGACSHVADGRMDMEIVISKEWIVIVAVGEVEEGQRDVDIARAEYKQMIEWVRPGCRKVEVASL